MSPLHCAPYRLLQWFQLIRGVTQRLHFSLYVRHPFQAFRVDMFGGVLVRLVNYYRREEIEAWFRGASLERVRIDLKWAGGVLSGALHSL